MTSTELDPLKKALGAYGAQLNLEKAAYSGKADQYLQQQFAAALKPAQERSRTGETPLAPADAHTTRLDTAGEQLFQEWRKQWAPHDSGEDYDLRGAYQEGLLPGDDGHWSDRYKKPNHPTFSVESVYAQQGNPGHWTGENHDIYVAPKAGAELATRNEFAVDRSTWQ